MKGTIPPRIDVNSKSREAGEDAMRFHGFHGESHSPGSTAASEESPSLGLSLASNRPRKFSDLRESDFEGDGCSAVENTDFEDSISASSMSRLRFDDTLAGVTEGGEMKVFACAPPFEEEIAQSLKRSAQLAAEILSMDHKAPDRDGALEARLQAMEQQLIDKDLEIASLKQALQEARQAAQAAASVQAKLGQGCCVCGRSS